MVLVRGSRSRTPRGERDGLVSRVLLDEEAVAGGGLTVTWAGVAPGSVRMAHAYVPEQVYVVVGE